MMKFAFIILLNISLFAQIEIKDFKYPDFYKTDNLKKTNSKTPLSNSILDIVTNGDTVWLGTSRGLTMSPDGGKNWLNFYDTFDFGTESITALGFNNGIIWAATGHSVEQDGGTFPEGSGLRYSEDGGLSWKLVPQPVDDENDTITVYGVNNIRSLPVTVAINNIIYDIGFLGNNIFIATFAGGLRMSSDKGETWQRVVIPPDYLNEIHPDSSYSFNLQPVAGNFGNESNLNHRLFSVTYGGENTIYAGSAGGINRGTLLPSGEFYWQKFNHTNQDFSISGNFVTALGYSENNNSIWAATWKAEGESEFYGVSGSYDNGETWLTFLDGEKAHNFSFRTYNIAGTQIAQILTVTDNGVFRTTDFNNEPLTWLSPSQIVDDVTKIPILSNVFYSVKYHKTEGNNIIWIGSADAGLAKFTESGSGMWNGNWVVYLASQPLESDSETYAFPNPFSPDEEFTRIKFSFNSASANVSIRIFDFGMNLVKTLIQNAVRYGNQDNIEFWNGRDESGNILPNGVYFYRIDIEGQEPLFGKIMVLM